MKNRYGIIIFCVILAGLTLFTVRSCTTVEKIHTFKVKGSTISDIEVRSSVRSLTWIESPAPKNITKPFKVNLFFKRATPFTAQITGITSVRADDKTSLDIRRAGTLTSKSDELDPYKPEQEQDSYYFARHRFDDVDLALESQTLIVTAEFCDQDGKGCESLDFPLTVEAGTYTRTEFTSLWDILSGIGAANL